MNRRHFLRTACAATGAAALGGTCYGFFEAGWVKVDRKTLGLPRLPGAFQNLTVAFLTDIHHGPYVDLDYVAAVVRTTNLLNPDLILLGGDYCLRESKYIAPVFEVLAGLRAGLGVHGVFGNHDYWHGASESRDGMKAAGITELTNRNLGFERKGERLRVAGLDDLWAGRPDLDQALAGVRATDACLLVSHNPDVAETLDDPRVGLVLSGHTHGGQILFPGCGAPWTPSRYGQKYLRGLVQAPQTKVYISRGLGTAAVPARLGSRPEINFLTLVRAG